jgi:hypothetical protein
VTVTTIVIWTICAAVCAQVAGNKGHNRATWALVGIATGVFGVLAAALLKPKQAETRLPKPPPNW